MYALVNTFFVTPHCITTLLKEFSGLTIVKECFESSYVKCDSNFIIFLFSALRIKKNNMSSYNKNQLNYPIIVLQDILKQVSGDSNAFQVESEEKENSFSPVFQEHDYQLKEIAPCAIIQNDIMGTIDSPVIQEFDKILISAPNDAYEAININNNILDPDYVPSDESISSDSFNYSELEQNKNSNVLKNVNNSKKSNISTDIDSSTNAPGSSACDDLNMLVAKRSTNAGCKKNFCFFCKTQQTKISRHLENKHANEEEVQKFILLPKGNKERKQIIDILRRKCDFLHNVNDEYNKGQLIVCRRPNKKREKQACDYTACSKCKGFFSKTTIRHHYDRCISTTKKQKRSVMVNARATLGRIHAVASEIMRKVIFPVLREDKFTLLLRYDKLLIIYGNKLSIKYRPQHQHDLIRARLRLTARFLYAVKQINKKITDFASIYDPVYYDDCVAAINIIAGLNHDTNTYRAPSVTSNMGTFLKQIGNIYISECIKNHDSKSKENIENFLKLFEEDFGINVNKTVEETQMQNKRRKKIVLPSNEDIKKLREHLKHIRDEAYKKLKIEFSYKAWLSLAEAVLTSIQIFNRRRSGEIERILIKDYENYQYIDEKTDPAAFAKLTPEAREHVKKYRRFVIRGKKNRTVSVLVNSMQVICISMLLKYRNDAKVHAKNPFLFVIPGYYRKRFKYLRACILMRKFSVDCKAECPQSLRGTELRKHIATKCVELELSENQVVDLANFSGHEERIHRQHYRQPIASQEILIMSRLLEMAQGVGMEKDDSDSEIDDTNTIKEATIIGSNQLNKTNESSMDNIDESITTSCTNTSLEVSHEKLISHKKKASLSPIKRQAPQVKTWMSNLYKTWKVVEIGIRCNGILVDLVELRYKGPMHNIDIWYDLDNKSICSVYSEVISTMDET
ncbi:uncharacterized protein [Prorops nasuta]|uniref:uncharacterized protein n=1 Tax=Prorops nasuta TaxID=863751 RepID=UPI0034CF280B